MGMDAKLGEAVVAAVSAAGQSEALSRRLVAWLEAVTSGNEDLNDDAAADRHLEFIYGEVALGEASPDDDDDGDETELDEDA